MKISIRPEVTEQSATLNSFLIKQMTASACIQAAKHSEITSWPGVSIMVVIYVFTACFIIQFDEGKILPDNICQNKHCYIFESLTFGTTIF